MHRPIETIGRLVGVGVLVLALMLSLRSPTADVSRAPRALSNDAVADSTGRGAALELSRVLLDRGQRDGARGADATDSIGQSVHLTLQRIPSAALRATLAAASLAGLPLDWTDSTAARGLAVSATAAADPQGGTIARARAQNTQPLVLRDAASTLDSVADASRGLAVSGARLSARIEARQGRSRAAVDVPAQALLRRLLLFARPGWEAKFVTAALEERGWKVDGRLLIGRNAFVTTGMPSGADTTRYAAVIVLDSGVVPAEPLSRFVRQGGGVVLGGDALRDAALRTLHPASPDGERPMVPGALLTDAPRRGLDAWELRPQRNAVVLVQESHGTHADPTVVVRRIASGRVLASAYRETWRWRMEGPVDGLEAHGAWWSALVSAVAFVPQRDTRVLRNDRPDSARGIPSVARFDSAIAAGARAAQRSPYPGDAAPYADLVARLGAPVALPTVRPTPATSPTVWWRASWLWFVVAAVALVTEWTSRRVRGAA